ncbi:hypothetical protein CW304_21330 [Bacillus sp. UFRGS-B20]|nr:hypothetical protein CW304_21330 [Bacillus sp. UFRGS-B20]
MLRIVVDKISSFFKTHGMIRYFILCLSVYHNSFLFCSWLSSFPYCCKAFDNRFEAFDFLDQNGCRRAPSGSLTKHKACCKAFSTNFFLSLYDQLPAHNFF